MEFSKKTLNRFCKDFKIPITIFEEPIFSYQKELYNDYYGLDSKFELLEKEIAKFDTEEQFLENLFTVRDMIITETKKLDAYQEFISMDMNKFAIKSDVSAKDIFKADNVGKTFLSIDLRKANFQALKYVNSDLVFGADTYEDYIDKFTDSEYLKQSKYLRQVIFGNMNPRRQVTVEKYLMKQILDGILNFEFVSDISSNLVSFSNDELIFELSDTKLQTIFDACVVDALPNFKFSIETRTELFKLSRVGDEPFYIKEFLTGRYEFKGIPKEYFPQVFKKYNNMEICDEDLYFIHNNELCKFVNPMF